MCRTVHVAKLIFMLIAAVTAMLHSRLVLLAGIAILNMIVRIIIVTGQLVHGGNSHYWDLIRFS
jgi:hypothetical protein